MLPADGWNPAGLRQPCYSPSRRPEPKMPHNDSYSRGRSMSSRPMNLLACSSTEPEDNQP